MKRSRDLQVEHLEEFGGLADELARLWRLIFDRVFKEPPASAAALLAARGLPA